MAMRIAPAASRPTHTENSFSAPSAPGVHDTLRSSLSSTPSKTFTTTGEAVPQIQSSHPLEARLAKWKETQENLKMEGLRRQFGVAEPIRRGMALKIARAGEWRPMALGGSAGVHSDVLAGRECEVGWEDVFKGDELVNPPDFHTEMEARLKMT